MSWLVFGLLGKFSGRKQPLMHMYMCNNVSLSPSIYPGVTDLHLLKKLEVLMSFLQKMCGILLPIYEKGVVKN